MLGLRYHDMERMELMPPPNWIEEKEKAKKAASLLKHKATCLRNHKKRHNRNKRK